MMANSMTKEEDKPTAHKRFDVIHGNALRCYAELVSECGGTAERLVQSASIHPAALTGDAPLEYRRLIDLLQRSAIQLGVDDFGLRLAQKQRGGKVIGPIGVVMKNSETVGQALGYCAKHIHAYSLATKVRFIPDRPHHQLFIALDLLLDDTVDTRQAIEHALALANYNLIDISGGKARARCVHLRHTPCTDPRNYDAAFGCPVSFGMERDGLFLSEDDLLCKVIEADDQILEMATDYIATRYPSALPPLHARVRNIIQRLLTDGNCQFECVAEELCLHPRTLQRRLRDEGTSFETIRDDVRRDVALRLLHQPAIPLTHIAHKIGYAETSVLSRSCQRWFAATPEQIRRTSNEAPPRPFLSYDVA